MVPHGGAVRKMKINANNFKDLRDFTPYVKILGQTVELSKTGSLVLKPKSQAYFVITFRISLAPVEIKYFYKLMTQLPKSYYYRK